MNDQDVTRRTLLAVAGAAGLGAITAGTATAQQEESAGGREPSESRLETFRAPTRVGAGAETSQQSTGAVDRAPSASNLESSQASSGGGTAGNTGELLEPIRLGPVTGVVSRRFTFRENSNTPGRLLERSVAISVPPNSGFVVSMSYFTAGFTNANFSSLTERPLGQFLFAVGMRGNNLVCQVRLTDRNSDDPVFIEVDANVLFFS